MPGPPISTLFPYTTLFRSLFIQSVRRYGEFYGDSLMVEYPKGSGVTMNLCDVADELTKRIISLFEKDTEGKRRLYGEYAWFYQQPENQHLVLFYEYFHGDNGSGLGASHQTGWTALVAQLISEYGQHKKAEKEQLTAL